MTNCRFILLNGLTFKTILLSASAPLSLSSCRTQRQIKGFITFHTNSCQGVIPITRRHSTWKAYPWFNYWLLQETSQDNKSYVEGQNKDLFSSRYYSLGHPGYVFRVTWYERVFFVSDTSLRRSGKAPYKDEATAVVWIERLVLIGPQNMTSFHLEQTINKRIHLRKTEKGGKKCRARRSFSPIWDLQKELFIITLRSALTLYLYSSSRRIPYLLFKNVGMWR